MSELHKFILNKLGTKNKNITYSHIFSDLKNKNNEFDEFINYHLKSNIITSTGKFEKIKYDPTQEKYHEIQKKQKLMELAIRTNNLDLINYIYKKFGDVVFCEKKPTPDFNLLNPFTLVENVSVIEFLKSINLNICYNSNKYTKYEGIFVLEQIIYKKNQKLYELILDYFNKEIEEFGLKLNSQNFSGEKIDIFYLNDNNTLEYLCL